MNRMAGRAALCATFERLYRDAVRRGMNDLACMYAKQAIIIARAVYRDA